MYVLLALLLLSVLIMVHEAGHFWAARVCGIAVQKFAMGMGPVLWKKQGSKGTEFSLRLFPIGGFCQFYDDDDEDGIPDPRAFHRQPVWKRLVTVISGPLMNLVAAWLVIVVYLSGIGILMTVPRVADVEAPAMEAGLCAGDVLLSVNGKVIAGVEDVVRGISDSEGQSVILRVQRGEEQQDLMLTPFYDEEVERYRVGFSFAQERQRFALHKSMPFSLMYNRETMRSIGMALKGMITGGEGLDEVSGPVGTIYVIEEVTRAGGVDIYLEMLAMISVNLGMMNLLPVPGLDGSRILFLLLEAIRRKPIRRELEGAVYGAGFVLLMGLMVILTYKDIMQIFVK